MDLLIPRRWAASVPVLLAMMAIHCYASFGDYEAVLRVYGAVLHGLLPARAKVDSC